jgi:5-formyltetrahydrofolate cyclo-ligase
MRAEGETASMKSALRARILQQRWANICTRVFDSPTWQKARSVALFSPLRTEPQIGPLEAGAVTTGKSTFIIPQTMRVEAQFDLPFSPELILVPALVGTRRTSIQLGICFAFQLVETIPIEPHAAIMNAVISDEASLIPKRCSC